MATEVVMPRTSYEMLEVNILQWLKTEGEQVQEGEALFEIETDKAVVMVEAPASGTLCGIRVQAGQPAATGSVVAFICAPGESVPQLEHVPAERVEASTGTSIDVRQTLSGKGSVPRVGITPIARRIARQHNIDLSTIVGSGPGGGIVKADIMRALESQQQEAVRPSAEPPYRYVELSHHRRATGERLSRSLGPVPHFVLEVEADMGTAERFRAGLVERDGSTVSYTSLIVKAVGMSLKEYPEVNAALDGKRIKIFDEVNVGVAMAVSDGLIVPVIRRADEKDVREIDKNLRRLRAQAEEGTFRPEDLAGGTFTVSNLGMFGVDSFQAIINPPQAAILATGRIRETAVHTKDGIGFHPMMNMKLSVDHRVLDGAMAAPFLVRVKELLEECEFVG